MQEPKPEAQSRLPRMPWAPPRRPPSGSASRFTAQRRRPPATAAGNSKLSLVDASLDFWHCAELETDLALQRRVEDAAEFAQVYLDWKRASGKRVPFGPALELHMAQHERAGDVHRLREQQARLVEYPPGPVRA